LALQPPVPFEQPSVQWTLNLSNISVSTSAPFPVAIPFGTTSRTLSEPGTTRAVNDVHLHGS
jgi:hypothetical protein